MCIENRPLLVEMGTHTRKACQHYLTRGDRWQHAWIRNMVNTAITAAYRYNHFETPEFRLKYLHHLYIIRWWYSTPLSYQKGSVSFDKSVFNHLRLLAILDQPDRLNGHIAVRSKMGGFVTNPNMFVEWFGNQRHWLQHMDRIRIRYSIDWTYTIVEKQRMGNRYSRIH